VENINNHIMTGELYKALKDAKSLIIYETELLDHAKREHDQCGDCAGERSSA
jgi:flagellar protein FlbT